MEICNVELNFFKFNSFICWSSEDQFHQHQLANKSHEVDSNNEVTAGRRRSRQNTAGQNTAGQNIAGQNTANQNAAVKTPPKKTPPKKMPQAVFWRCFHWPIGHPYSVNNRPNLT
jgi:hypothetical protein